jgi:protein O-mannosyl-transferase
MSGASRRATFARALGFGAGGTGRWSQAVIHEPASRPEVSSPQAPPSDVRTSRAREAYRASHLLLLTVLACAALPYLNMLGNGFVYDDHTQVTNNPYIQSFSHLKEIFTTTVWSYVGVQGVTNYYRPMMTFGYLVCYRLFGPLAYGFHLASLLLHMAIVGLIFAVTLRIVRDRVWAFAAAAWFALHPIHTESVAWIAAVTDLELTFFYLAAFWFFLGVSWPGGGRSEGAMLGTVAAFILALLSKEQALTFAALATVYEHFYREDSRKTRLSRKLARYGPLWLLALAYILFRIRFLGALAPVDQIRTLTAQQTVLSAVALVGQYVEKLLWPAELCAFYVFHRSTSLFDPRVLGGVAALGALGALFLICWRSRKPEVHFASFGIIWFFATLGPVLNAHWMAANVFTERYLYLPSVGIAWLAGLGASKLWSSAADRPGSRRALALGGIAAGALLAARIVIRNHDWRNDIALYGQTLKLSPDAYPILNNLGTVYWQAGAVGQAESAWRRALALRPDNAIVLNNLGLVVSKRKQYPEAVGFFRRAVRLKPNYTDPHLNLGTTYREMGEATAAELQLRAAVALSPLNYRARNELGQLLMTRGRFEEAEKEFRRSAESEPNLLAYDFLAELCLRRGDAPGAESAFRRSLALDAFDARAHFGLGKLEAAAGRKAEAMGEYRAGLETDPSNIEARTALRALQAETSPPAP